MNSLLRQLAQACRERVIEEKVLVVPDFRAGYEICETLARRYGGWLNLRSETTTSLALSIAQTDLANRGIRLISGALARSVVEEILQGLESQSALAYFTRSPGATGLVKSLARSVLELRSFGVTAGGLRQDSFIDPCKGRDMVMIMKSYEGYLTTHSFIDRPGLLLLARRLLAERNFGSRRAVYLLPDFLRLSTVERDLLQELAGGQLAILHVDADREAADLAVTTDVERLPWLQRVGEAPLPVRDGSLAYYHAYGIINEVREVLRRLLAGQVPLDQVTLAYSNNEYIPVVYDLALRTGFGLTVEEGIPAALTRPGRILKGVLDWIGSDYDAGVLRNLLTGENVELTAAVGETVTATQAGRFLRQARTGWGRERYVRLTELAEVLQQRAALDLYGEDSDELERRRSALVEQGDVAARFSSLVQRLLATIPEPDDQGMVDFHLFTAGLAILLQNLTAPASEDEVGTLQSLEQALRQCGTLVSWQLPLEAALGRVDTLLAETRVQASGPAPGKLHLTGYRSLVWSDRPYTYLVGLDAGRFPGNSRQDPVLLDSERSCINPALPLSANRPRENVADMARALASRSGRVVLSFSSFDPVDNRAVYPSSLLLQLYRLLQGDGALDYTSLLSSLGSPAGYAPATGMPALDEGEWWLQQCVCGAPTGSRSVLVWRYPGLGEGLRAVSARQLPEVTGYDGLVDVTPGLLDPRCTKKRVFSCSALECLAGCPFAYFLKYVLNIFPPDDLDFDPGHWLDPLERGSLMHDLYCNFMRDVTARGEKVSQSLHHNLIHGLAEKLIANYREKVPPPSGAVFQTEVRDIHQSCDLFLSMEEAEDATPLWFEVPFGMGPEAVAEAGCGLRGPVEIDLGEGRSFRLAGRIDRIDRVGENCYNVWDYKTGSAYGYQDGRVFWQGRQVQHALYAIVAREIITRLRPGSLPRVDTAGYRFPTVKGEGERVGHSEEERLRIGAVINNLLDILAGGLFVVADDGAKCTFCEYGAVCDQTRAVPRAKALAADQEGPHLAVWRRLKRYE